VSSRPHRSSIGGNLDTVASKITVRPSQKGRTQFSKGASQVGKGQYRCACRKSDSAILVVQAAEDRLRCDDAEVLNRPMKWGILVQRAMNARFIIVRGIAAQDPAQVRLPEHDHVVETFPADRADQPLDVWVLPWRPGSGRLVPNPHG